MRSKPETVSCRLSSEKKEKLLEMLNSMGKTAQEVLENLIDIRLEDNEESEHK